MSQIHVGFSLKLQATHTYKKEILDNWTSKNTRYLIRLTPNIKNSCIQHLLTVIEKAFLS